MDYSKYSIIRDINAQHGVYLVKETDTGRRLVCKELSTYNKAVYEYIKTHQVSHIPSIISIAEKNNTLTVIEEYVEGNSLQTLLDNNTVYSREQILDWAIQICKILDSIHTLDKPIIHRDIKPSNIIVTPNDEIYLIDLNAGKFGNPEILNSSDTTLLGTPGFAAPEQYGFGESTPKTDIYTLGILIRKLVNNISADSYVSDILRISDKCSAIDPDDRYDSINIVLKELIKSCKTDTKSVWHKFLQTPVGKLTLPGYRSGNVFHIFIATIYYSLVLFLVWNLQITSNVVKLLVVYRIVLGLILLATPLCTFNYLGIHSFFPLCESKKPGVKLLGIIMLNATVYAILLTGLVIAAQFV